jgi:hypothetical protein
MYASGSGLSDNNKKVNFKMVGSAVSSEQSKGTKMALEGNPGRRRKGRLRKRWLDDVQDDIIKMSVERWRTKAMDRGEWRKICEVAKVLQEL